MGFNFREAATSGLYATAGAMEGLRQHRNYVREDERQRFAERMQMEQLALDRFRVDTAVTAQADELAMREKEFLDSKAKWEANLEFERKKLQELARQFGAELPIKERTAKAAEMSAEARGTAADASTIRAKAARDKVSADGGFLTPKGIMAEYGKTYREAYKAKKEATLQRFGKFDLDAQAEAELAGTNAAKAAVRESIEAYNENALLYGFKPIGTGDIAVQYEEEAETEAANEAWETLKADPSFGQRFETGKLTPQELEVLKSNDPELHRIYEQARNREKINKAKVNRPLNTSDAPSNPSRRPADFR